MVQFDATLKYGTQYNLHNQAMEVDSYNSKLFSNRCTAYLLLENYDKALADATKCVSIDPDWYKGHVQMGSCYMGMKDYQSAIKEYRKGGQTVSSIHLQRYLCQIQRIQFRS